MVLAQIEVLLENSADVSVDLVWFEPVPKSALHWYGVVCVTVERKAARATSGLSHP